MSLEKLLGACHKLSAIVSYRGNVGTLKCGEAECNAYTREATVLPEYGIYDYRGWLWRGHWVCPLCQGGRGPVRDPDMFYPELPALRERRAFAVRDGLARKETP